MSFISSDSGSSKNTFQESKLSNVFIKKPHTLSETCPVETTTQRLPLIGERSWIKKEAKNITESCSGSEENWLKPGISLPKLRPKKVSQSFCPPKDEVKDSLKNKEFNLFSRLKGVRADSVRGHQQAISKLLNCYKNIEELGTDDPDVVGPSDCQNVFRVPSSELNFDEFKAKEEKMEESHALQRWKYWLEQDKRLQQYLCKRLNRKKRDLQFQKTQNYRMMVEDKSLFVFAQIPVADKWRGHPFLWKSDLKIGGAKTKLLNEDFAPEYYGVKTKLEKGEVPDLEFIGIPMVIKKEKGLISEDVADYGILNPGWEKLPYRQDRLRDLRQQTKKLKPHDVQMDELQVVGKKILQKPEGNTSIPSTFENLPTIRVTEIKNEDSCSRNSYSDQSSVFWLSIGGKELKYEIGNEYCQNTKKNKVDLEWEIDFGVNPVGVLVERTLKFENKGTLAVKYEFFRQHLKTSHSLNTFLLKQHEPWFFFNKNSGIFLPGQIYDFKFYNYSKRSGVRKEIWCFRTQPPLSKTKESGVIVLWAVSTGDSSNSDITVLDSYFRKRVTSSVINFVLQNLICKVFNPSENLRGIEYRSLFLERELFEYQNPKHFYHSVIVKKLHEIFEQIPNKKQKEWDLSLSSLVELVTIHVTKENKDILFRQIAENAKKLLKPNHLFIKNIKRYRMTYEILCKMTDFIDEDYDYLKNCLFEKREQIKKVSSDFGEAEEEYNVSSTISEEKMGEEFGLNFAEVILEIKPIDFLYFQNMFYLKVYERVVEAVECIIGALETSKLSEPWKEVNYKFEKPCRGAKK